MFLERDGHISFEEVEAVKEYIDLKLTLKVFCLDLAKKLPKRGATPILHQIWF